MVRNMPINSRTKGKQGELEFRNIMIDLTGFDINRNLDQTRAGGHDLDGLPFAMEIKRYKEITRGEIVAFWRQAVEQSETAGLPPALAYRENAKKWKVVIPLALIYHGSWKHCEECNVVHPPEWLDDFEYTVTMEIDAFAYICREMVSADAEIEMLNSGVKH